MDKTGIHRFVEYFENLDRNNLAGIAKIYSENARFVDPFNEVDGISAIKIIFQDMYRRCSTANFIVNETVVEGEIAYVRWIFNYSTTTRPKDKRCIEGVSRLVFETSGLVTEHIDYWDAARQIYEPLPVIGSVLRYVRQRIGAAV